MGKKSKANRSRRQAAAAEAPMGPFRRAACTPEEADRLRAAVADAILNRAALGPNPRPAPGEAAGLAERLVREEVLGCRHYRNDRYQVSVRDVPEVPGVWPAMVHLSIRRLDRGPVRDWRDVQRIKDELVGPEHEGLELYPAASRLLDTANQYHVYCLAEPGVRFPFGYLQDARGPELSEVSLAGSVQRPFAVPARGVKP